MIKSFKKNQRGGLNRLRNWIWGNPENGPGENINVDWQNVPSARDINAQIMTNVMERVAHHTNIGRRLARQHGMSNAEVNDEVRHELEELMAANTGSNVRGGGGAVGNSPQNIMNNDDFEALLYDDQDEQVRGGGVGRGGSGGQSALLNSLFPSVPNHSFGVSNSNTGRVRRRSGSGGGGAKSTTSRAISRAMPAPSKRKTTKNSQNNRLKSKLRRDKQRLTNLNQRHKNLF